MDKQTSAIVNPSHARLRSGCDESGTMRNTLQARACSVSAKRREMKRVVENHLDWHNEVPTSFLSTFDNRAHAMAWVSNLYDNTGIMDILHVVDTAKLGPVFRVLNLMS